MACGRCSQRQASIQARLTAAKATPKAAAADAPVKAAPTALARKPLMQRILRGKDA